MTRENYFKFKKKLMNTGNIYKVNKKGNFITVIPDQAKEIWNFEDFIDELFYKIDKNYNDYYIKNSNRFGISSKLGCFDVVDFEQSNSTIYSFKLKIS